MEDLGNCRHGFASYMFRGDYSSTLLSLLVQVGSSSPSSIHKPLIIHKENTKEINV